jgi:hypothetical protein
MASLQDTIRKNSQKLVRGADGTLQQLAGQAGIPAAPTGVVGAATIGATPQQQKMVGSPAQVQNAMRQSVDPSQTLEEAEARRQVRSQKTTSEAKEASEAKKYQALGATGERAQQLIDTAFDKISATAAQHSNLSAPGVTGLPTDPKGLANLNRTLTTYRDSGGKDLEAAKQINQLLGRNLATVIDPTQVQQLYEAVPDAIARTGADAIRNNLTVGDLTGLPAFGYNLASLSSLLGVPADKLGKMSIPDLESTVSSIVGNKFATEAGQQQAASNANLGAAERGVAHQNVAEAQATGTATVEAGMRNIADQIARADTVGFGGKQWKIDELLSDENVSKMITTFLSDPNSKEAKAFAASEPAFVGWITKNQKALGEAAKQMQAGEQKLIDTSKAAASLGTVGGTEMDPGLLKKIVPNWDPTALSTKAIDTSKVPVFQAMQKLPPEQQKSYVEGLNKLVGADPGLADEIAKADADTLSKLRLDEYGKPNGSSKAIDDLLANKKMREQLENIDPADIDTLVSMVGGGQYDSKWMQSVIEDGKALQTLGLGEPEKAALFLDSDGDGKLDDGETIRQNLLKQNPKASLADAVSGKATTYAPIGVENKAAQLSGTDRMLFTKLRDASLDGEITVPEIADAALSDSELLSLQDSPKVFGSLAPTVQKAVQQQVEMNARRNTLEILNPLYKIQGPTGSDVHYETTESQGGAPGGNVPTMGTILDFQKKADDIEKMKKDLDDQILEWEHGSGDRDPRLVQVDTLKHLAGSLSDTVRKYREKADQLLGTRNATLANQVMWAAPGATPNVGSVGNSAKDAVLPFDIPKPVFANPSPRLSGSAAKKLI